ncbi:hypothetical protein ACWGOQ_0000865 [Aquimarina sp. M1]
MYYQVKVEEKRGGKNQSWHTIIKEDKGTDFVVETSGGKAVVLASLSPKTKMVYLVRDVKQLSGTWNDPPEHLEKFLNSYGKDSSGLFGFTKAYAIKRE